MPSLSHSTNAFPPIYPRTFCFYHWFRSPASSISLLATFCVLFSYFQKNYAGSRTKAKQGTLDFWNVLAVFRLKETDTHNLPTLIFLATPLLVLFVILVQLDRRLSDYHIFRLSDCRPSSIGREGPTKSYSKICSHEAWGWRPTWSNPFGPNSLDLMFACWPVCRSDSPTRYLIFFFFLFSDIKTVASTHDVHFARYSASDTHTDTQWTHMYPNLRSPFFVLTVLTFIHAPCSVMFVPVLSSMMEEDTEDWEMEERLAALPPTKRRKKRKKGKNGIVRNNKQTACRQTLPYPKRPVLLLFYLSATFLHCVS